MLRPADNHGIAMEDAAVLDRIDRQGRDVHRHIFVAEGEIQPREPLRA